MKRMIIDAHTHIFPDKIADKAAINIGKFYGFDDMYKSAKVSELLKSEEDAGVSLSLVCSSAVVPEQTVQINNFIKSACSVSKALMGLGTCHAGFSDIDGECERIKSIGLHGIKLHPDFQHFDIDCDGALPIYRAAIKYDLPVLFHMGDKRYEYSSPEKLAKIIIKFPSLKVHAAHFGGYSVWDEAYSFLQRSDNLYFDISSSLSWLEKDKVLAFFDKFGIDRYMFGSDFPMWEPKKELEKLHSLGLSESELQKVEYSNFIDFYGVKPE